MVGTRWSHHLLSTDARNLIATAATNGAVVIWDLNKAPGQKQGKAMIDLEAFCWRDETKLSITDRIITEHTRAVNRISFHPTDSVILLSASQDGTMKLWVSGSIAPLTLRGCTTFCG
jgi:WD40 repeat protein